MSESNDVRRGHFPRAPLVPVAVGFVVGILIQSGLDVPVAALFLAMGSSLVVGVVTLVASAWYRESLSDRTRAVECIALLVANGLAGAIWYELGQTPAAPHDIQSIAAESPRLVRLQGTVDSLPEVRKRANPYGAGRDRQRPPDEIRTQFVVNLERVDVGLGWTATTGAVQVTVDGEVGQPIEGHSITVLGWLRKPNSPTNPGEFNFAAWLAAQQIWATLRVDHPDALVISNESVDPRLWLAAWRGQLRRSLASAIRRDVWPSAAPTVEAMLLGTRTALDNELKMAFRESGLLHLLAISGLNIAILCQAIVACCRLVYLPRTLTLAAALVVTVAYAALVDSNPPVVRAALFAALATSGLLLSRTVNIANLLALTVLIMLWSNPTDLFHLGAQLSFLAVLSLTFAFQWLAAWTEYRGAWQPGDPPAWREWLAGLGQAFFVSAFCWAVSLPLLASQVNLVSPLAVLTNLLAAPLALAALWLGYAYLIVALVAPPIAGAIGILLGGCVWVFLGLVQGSANVFGGHLYVGGPPGWWLAGWLTLVGIVLSRQFLVGRRSSVSGDPAALWLLFPKRLMFAVVGWCIAGLVWGAIPVRRTGLNVTFLNVGHGLAVLVECPTGQTLLYDAGAMGQPERAANVIAGALRSKGIGGVDAILLSHADADHLNGVAGLLNQFPVGEILVSPQFLQGEDPLVNELASQVRQQGIRIQTISQSQRLGSLGDVEIVARHPPAMFSAPRDNAKSLVLEVRYAGKVLLLTGDLEQSGLKALFEQPRGRYDVLLAPHHGSKTSNSPLFAAWANPEFVISSQAPSDSTKALVRAYENRSQIFTTAVHGAVAVEISPLGEILVSPFRRLEPL